MTEGDPSLPASKARTLESMTKWTAEDVVDQTGRTFVVTGANSGLGEVVARALGKAGADVALACRDTTKADAVAAEIGPNAVVRKLDLSDLSSVRAFADATEKVDVLVNNAGVMAVPFRRTVDGFEMQIGTNHLGHFVLTDELLPALLAAPAARVVSLASIAHWPAKIKLDDLNFERRRYTKMGAYQQSKLANLLFSGELARRSEAAGTSITSIAAHPGVAATNLFDSMVPPIPGAVTMTHLGLRVVGNSEQEGALSQLYAATMPDANNDDYLGPTQLRGMRGPVRRSPRSKLARDRKLAADFWAKSVELTGATYGLLEPKSKSKR